MQSYDYFQVFATDRTYRGINKIDNPRLFRLHSPMRGAAKKPIRKSPTILANSRGKNTKLKKTKMLCRKLFRYAFVSASPAGVFSYAGVSVLARAAAFFSFEALFSASPWLYDACDLWVT